MAKGVVRYEAPPVSDLPLPLQVLLRATQHFAAKAADGADINLAWNPDPEAPHLSAWTKEGRLDILWSDAGMSIIFTRSAPGRYFIKRTEVEADKKVTSEVVAAVAQMIITACEALVVQLHPSLERIFALPTEQQAP
jgi:hypothetical protein